MTTVFTIKTVIKALERYIRVADCNIRGHLTIESDIVIMVTPSSLRNFQVPPQICQKVAEKVAVMIQTLSPRITSELSLSVLTTAVSLRDMHSTTSFYSSASNTVVPHLTMYLGFIAFRLIIRAEVIVS